MTDPDFVHSHTDLGLFKVDFLNRIKGQTNYPGSNLNQIKGQIKYLVSSLMFYQIEGYIKCWRRKTELKIKIFKILADP
jgi:hypothetical protein